MAAIGNERDSTNKRRLHDFRVNKNNLQQPVIAWPTVILAVSSLTLWLGTAYLGVAWSLPLWCTFPVSTIAIYMVFTPMHDAAHSSVARRPYRCVNELVGWLCSIPFLVIPHPIFRWLHLRHHKYTNDPELDPDYVRARDGRMALITHPIDIVLAVLNWIRTVYVYGCTIDTSTRNATALGLCANVMCIVVAVHSGVGHYLLIYWVYPALGAVVILAYVFDHVPHHPRSIKVCEDLYGATGTVDGIFDVGTGKSSWIFTCLMLGQNYHSIHHIFPTLPWYAYAKVWQAQRDEFLSSGVPLVSLFGKGAATCLPSKAE